MHQTLLVAGPRMGCVSGAVKGALLALLVTSGWSPAAPDTKTVPVPPPAPSEQQMRNAAAEFERRGEPLRAADYYERLLATNATANAVVRSRLVDIYAAAGRTNEALAHAQAEMKVRPDPPAYYAEALRRTGRPGEARALLERELVAETNAVRRGRLEAQRQELGGSR